MSNNFGSIFCKVDGESLGLDHALNVLKYRYRLDLLHVVAREALIGKISHDSNVTVSDDELQERMNDFRVHGELYKSSELDEWLDENELAMEDLEYFLERDALVIKLKAALDEDDVRRYFFENRKEFEGARLSYIFADEKSVAEEILAQIEEDGAVFGAMAVAHSRDESTKYSGGYAGWTRRADMESNLESSLFGASKIGPGSILGPIENGEMWVLAKVWEITLSSLDASTESTIRDILFQEWLESAMGKAEIELCVSD